MLILIFGSTHFAVSTVLTAFMAGLALGAYVLGRQIDRRWDPLVVYGVFEIGIGLYALVVPWLFGFLEPLSRWLWSAFSPSFYTFSVLRFLFVSIVLIVPTSLMGGTLPALSRFVTRRPEAIGLSVGSLYGLNTFGAVAGTALTGFALVPVLGVQRTIWLAAALNVVVGVVALVLWARSRRKGAREAAEVGGEPAGPPAGIPGRIRLVLVVFALSGFIAMVYEIAWTRVLSLIIGSSVYAFTIMLTTFLVGLAAGASIMSGLADRIGRKRGMEGIASLLALTGVTAFITLTFLHMLPYWFSLAFLVIDAGNPTGENQGLLFGLQFLLAGAVMLPPTLFLGGMFPLVVRICGGALKQVGRTVGTAYAANTVGTIFGSALGGFLVIPFLGIQGSIMAAIVLDLLLAALVLIFPGEEEGDRPRGRLVGAALCGAGALVFWILQPSWDVLLMNSGTYLSAKKMDGSHLTRETFDRYTRKRDELVFYKEGVTATVMVAKEPNGNLYLSMNGKVDASTQGDLATQLLSAHVPMLLATDIDDVLVIGYASGMTVGAATLYPIDSLTAVEIEPAVIEASKLFTEHNHEPLSNPRVDVVTGDGRNFLLVTDRKFDVIISEPSNPWMTVASNLFTREFFQLGKSRLKPGGVFCGWVQLYGLPPDLLRTMVRTFSGVFPHLSVYMPIPFADLILLGSDEPLDPDLGKLEGQMAGTAIGADLASMGVRSAADLLTYHLFGEAEARSFAGRGDLNTDDNALIEFNAPLALHARTGMLNARALVPHFSDPLAGALGLPADPEGLAAVYHDLGEAFFRREVAGRAVSSLNAAQELHPTEARAARILAMQEWFQQRIRQRQRQQQRRQKAAAAQPPGSSKRGNP
jgi:spermidine synthase